MNSNHLEILVERLNKEIQRNRKFIKDIQLKGEGGHIGVASNYIKYHEEMIRFIEELDKELV